MSEPQQTTPVPLVIEVLVGQSLTVYELRFLLRRIGLNDQPMSLVEMAQRYQKSYDTLRLAEQKLLLKIPRARLERTKGMLTRTLPSDELDSFTQAQRDALYTLVERGLLVHDLHSENSMFSAPPVPSLDKSLPAKQRKARPESRLTRLTGVLMQAQRPMHYRALFERARIRSDKTFTPELAYQVLYQDSRFRMIGSGVFAIAAWTARDVHDQLKWCPAPLLPADARADTFFETILLLREWLSEAPRTVDALLDFARVRFRMQIAYPQDALDVWYAAGLIMPADTTRLRASVRLMLPQDVTIHEARRMCVEAFTMRVAANDRLLAALDQLEGAAMERLQRAVYGSDDPFDLPNRMTIFEALGIVQQVEKNRWQLTGSGRAWAASQPPLVISLEEPALNLDDTQDALDWLDVL